MAQCPQGLDDSVLVSAFTVKRQSLVMECRRVVELPLKLRNDTQHPQGIRYPANVPKRAEQSQRFAAQLLRPRKFSGMSRRDRCADECLGKAAQVTSLAEQRHSLVE